MEFNDSQKKVLEKLFLRIFESDKLTDEGKQLCLQAHVRPEDLKVKSLDEFKLELKIEEVAKIRHQHYSLKRLRKLSLSFIHFIGKLAKIQKIMEEIAIQKKREEQAATSPERPNTTGNSGNFFSPMKKGYSNRKLAFYASSRENLGEKQNNRYLSETNGFFNIRQGRNPSIAGSAASNSKSFNNYLKAKERAQSLAKSYFEKQNLIALTKAKNEKLAEKQAKMEMDIIKDKIEKRQERQRATKHRKDLDTRGRERDAFESYKMNISEIKQRSEQIAMREKEVSQKTFHQQFE